MNLTLKVYLHTLSRNSYLCWGRRLAEGIRRLWRWSVVGK